MNRRTLSLKKETLASLASDDLRAVAGGAAAGDSIAPTCFTGLTVCGVCDKIPTHHYRGLAC